MASASIKRWLHFIGGGLGLAGVVFVGIRLHGHASEIEASRFGVTEWAALGLLSLIYGAANVFLARAWWWQLKFFEVRTDWLWALKAYGLSQLGKYVPGNIFHLAGRQALGMARGFPAQPLAKSAVWELGSIAVAGLIFGLLVLPLVWPQVGVMAAITLFLMTLAALYQLLTRFVAVAVAVALVWQVIFLAVSGLVFIASLALAADMPVPLSLAPTLCGAYVLAWLIGLVTPGAPAGIGIREAVLLLLLSNAFDGGTLILALVLSRIVTVIGDLIFFLAMTAMGGLPGHQQEAALGDD